MNFKDQYEKGRNQKVVSDFSVQNQMFKNEQNLQI